MDSEWEGFKQQAMALFAWQQVLRPTLPQKINAKLRRRGQRAAAKAGAAIMSNTHVRQRMWEALMYNCTRSAFSGYEARVYCFATLAQADAGTLAELETVKTQVAVCPEALDTAAQKFVVRVRFELLLTQEDDVTYADYYLRGMDLGASKVEPYKIQWEKLRAELKGDVPLEGLMSALIKCASCDKYSMSHKRCSGCHAVYYCGAECQTRHWPEHRGDCLYSQHLGPADAWPQRTLQTLVPE